MVISTHGVTDLFKTPSKYYQTTSVHIGEEQTLIIADKRDADFVRKKVPKERNRLPRFMQELKAMELQCFTDVPKPAVNKPGWGSGGRVARSVLRPYSNAAPSHSAPAGIVRIPLCTPRPCRDSK